MRARGSRDRSNVRGTFSNAKCLAPWAYNVPSRAKYPSRTLLTTAAWSSGSRNVLNKSLMPIQVANNAFSGLQGAYAGFDCMLFAQLLN